MTNVPRISANNIFFIIIDLQEKLLAKIPSAERVVSRNLLLLQAARSLKIPYLPTTQYRAGLGPLPPRLSEKVDVEVPDKTFFSCARDAGIQSRVDALGRKIAVVSGIETHICVLQTTLDLLELDYEAFVVADAVASRHELDHNCGLERMEQAGATLVTAEMVIYELLGCSDSPEFKKLLPFIKQL